MKKTVLLVVLAALAAGCASVKEQKCAEGRYDFLTKKFNMWNIIPPSIGFEETTIKDITKRYTDQDEGFVVVEVSVE